MKTLTIKFTLLAMILALVCAALPLGESRAAGLNDTATPPAPPTPGQKHDPAVINLRLENAFTREQSVVTRIGRAVDNFDQISTRIQGLLDRAREKGLDVSAVQSAFDAFKKAFPNGKPIYERAKGIVEEHAGFDASGNVTDTTSAVSTVKSLRETLVQYRSTVGDFVRALREAVKAFRAANPHTKPSATPGAAPTNG